MVLIANEIDNTPVRPVKKSHLTASAVMLVIIEAIFFVGLAFGTR